MALSQPQKGVKIESPRSRMSWGLCLRLSIIIPSYESKSPSQTLSQVIEQALSVPCHEIIVVDSSPIFEEPVINDPRLRFIRSDKRLFPGAARNLGAEKAQGDWLFFLDSDVLLETTALEFLRSQAWNPENEKVLHWGLYSMDANQTVWSWIQNKILHYRFYHLFRQTKGKAHGQSSHFLIHKKFFSQIGMFNPLIRMREDTDLAMRASLFGGEHQVHLQLTAKHLKQFSFVALVKDYYWRSFYSMRFQLIYPHVFKNLDPFVSSELKLFWFFPTFAALVLSFRFSWVGLGLALLSWFCFSLTLGQRMKGGWTLKRSLAGLSAGPLMGLALLLGVFSAAVLFWANQIKAGIYAATDWIHIAFKGFFKWGAPLHLTHFITNKCNLRCHHCFYKETLDAAPQEMSLEQAAELYSSVGSLLWVAVAGGEPFLRRDFSHLLSVIIRSARPKLITIPTNGFYTENIFTEILRTLQQHPRQKIALQFSIDGDLKIHDSIRGPGSWKHALESSQKLKQLRSLFPNLNLSLITVINSENSHLFPELLDQLSETFELDQIHINLFRHGFPSAPALPESLVKKYKESVDSYFKKSAQKTPRGYQRLLFAFYNYYSRKQKDIIYQVAAKNQFSVPCEGGTLSYTVWEDGQIGPCEILKERFTFPKFYQFWKEAKFQSLRQQIKKEKCRCTYECTMTINSVFGKTQKTNKI